LLDEWESADRQLLIRATYERSRALLAAGRGDAGEAERLGASAYRHAEPGAYRWQMLEALRARGIAALLAGAPDPAVEDLQAIWEDMEGEGLDDPGVFPVAPDLVEALVELGELDRARRVTDRLRKLSEQQEHPWGHAATKRCSGNHAEMAEAAEQYAALGL